MLKSDGLWLAPLSARLLPQGQKAEGLHSASGPSAVLRCSSLHMNMGDIRDMLTEVLRMFGASTISSLPQPWEAALLSTSLSAKASLLHHCLSFVV